MNDSRLLTAFLLLICACVIVAVAVKISRLLSSSLRRVYVHDAEYTNRDKPTPIGVGDRVWIRFLPSYFTVAQVHVDEEWCALVAGINRGAVQIVHIKKQGGKIRFWFEVSQISSTPIKHVPEPRVITELASPAA